MSVDDAGGDGGRLAGVGTFRGVAVILAAIVLGGLLLDRAVAEDDATVAAVGDDDTATPAEGGAGEEPPTTGDAGAPPSTTEAPATTTVPEPTVRQPAEVRVLVLNGSGRAGESARGVEFFTEAGYDTAPPANAPQPGPSVIHHAEGFEDEAVAVAAALDVDAGLVRPIDPAAPPAPDLQDAHVVVVAGTDGTIAF